MKYIKLLVVSCFLLINTAAYSETRVLQFYEFTDDVTFVADDVEFKFTTYTVVQNYGNDDERLFIGSLAQGDWVQLTYELSGEYRQRVVSKIEILENEDQVK